MTRLLIVGCPRHFEGHEVRRIPLPVRADAFAQLLRKYVCPTLVRPATKDDDGRCGFAIMVIGVEE